MITGRIEGTVEWDSFEGGFDAHFALTIPLAVAVEVPIELQVDHLELPIRRWSDLEGVRLLFDAGDVDWDDGQATPVGTARVRVGTVTADARVGELSFASGPAGFVAVTVTLSYVDRRPLPQVVPDLVGVHHADVELGTVRVSGRGARLADARQAAATLFDVSTFVERHDGATVVLSPDPNRPAGP